jgi:hypothetical protein
MFSPLFQVIFALNPTFLQQESLRGGSLHMLYMTEELIHAGSCRDLGSVIFSHDSSQVSGLAFCQAQEQKHCPPTPGHPVYKG